MDNVSVYKLLSPLPRTHRNMYPETVQIARKRLIEEGKTYVKLCK